MMDSTNLFGEDTVRDVMKDRLRDVLADYCGIPMINVNTELVCDLADEAFSVCGISEKEQDEVW